MCLKINVLTDLKILRIDCSHCKFDETRRDYNSGLACKQADHVDIEVKGCICAFGEMRPIASK